MVGTCARPANDTTAPTVPNPPVLTHSDEGSVHGDSHNPSLEPPVKLPHPSEDSPPPHPTQCKE